VENTKIHKLKMLGYTECVRSDYSILIRDNRTMAVAEYGNPIEIDTRNKIAEIRETKFSNGLSVITFSADENTDELIVTCNGIRRTSVGVAHVYFKGKELNDGVYEAEFSEYTLKIINATELANNYCLKMVLIDKSNGKSIHTSVDYGERNMFVNSRLDRLTPFYDFSTEELKIHLIRGSSFDNSVMLLNSCIVSLKRNKVYPRSFYDKIIEDIDTGEIYGTEKNRSGYKITNFIYGGTHTIDKETTNTITFGKQTIKYRIAILETHSAKDIQNDKIYDSSN